MKPSAHQGPGQLLFLLCGKTGVFVALPIISTNDKCEQHVPGRTLSHVCWNHVCAVWVNVLLHEGANQDPELPAPHQVQSDCTHRVAAHMGQGAPKDMLVTFVIGADDGQCHKISIVMIIIGIKRFRKAVHCSETGGLPTWKNFWLLQPVSSHP